MKKLNTSYFKINTLMWTRGEYNPDSSNNIAIVSFIKVILYKRMF